MIEISLEDGSKLELLSQELTIFRNGPADILEVFDDWQSRQLVANKRLFGTLSFILATVHFIGIDYSNLSFAGIETSGGEPFRVTVALSLPVLIFGFLYLVQLRVDRAARAVRLEELERNLKRSQKTLQEMREVAGLKKGTSLNEVIWPRKDRADKHARLDDIRARSVETLELYEGKLKANQSWMGVIETIEPYFLCALALYGLFGIVGFWLSDRSTSIQNYLPWWT